MHKLKEILACFFGTHGSFEDLSKNESDKFQSIFQDMSFSFRDGFSDRIIAKIKNLEETDPVIIYYRNLSSLFPRILGFSIALIIIMGLILFVIHGSLSPEKFIGADKINDANFISYLFLE